MELVVLFEVIICLVLFGWPHLLLLFVCHLYQVLRVLKVEVLQDIKDGIILCKNVLEGTLSEDVLEIAQMLVDMVFLDRVFNQFYFLSV